MFESLTGFVDFRARRRMCFVDFTTESQGASLLPHPPRRTRTALTLFVVVVVGVVTATQAMRKVQGHQMRPGAKGLAIDYDKDPVSKRNKNYEVLSSQRPPPVVCILLTRPFCTPP